MSKKVLNSSILRSMFDIALSNKAKAMGVLTLTLSANLAASSEAVEVQSQHLQSQHVNTAQSLPSALRTPFPLNLNTTLTQQLAKAALMLHSQAPLWTAAESAAPASTSTAASTVATSSITSLPQQPSAAVMSRVINLVTALPAPIVRKTVVAKLIVKAAAPIVSKPPVKVAAPAIRKPVVSKPVRVTAVQQTRRSGVSRRVNSTAYNSEVGQTDNSPFVTATGTRVRPGVIALSRDLLRTFPYGSRVTLQDSAGILNGRIFIVEDTMNVRIANTVDIWMGSRAEALRWGRRSITITAVR